MCIRICIHTHTHSHTHKHTHTQVGPGFEIKPYVVYTDLKVDPSDGLVVRKKSRKKKSKASSIVHSKAWHGPKTWS
jgi:hypothetical protein